MANLLEIIFRNVFNYFLYFHGHWFFLTNTRIIKAVLSFIDYKACLNVPKSNESLQILYILFLLAKNLLVYHGLKHELPPIVSLILFPTVLLYYSIQTVTMENVKFHLDPWSLSIIVLLLCLFRFWNLGPIEAISIVAFTAIAYFVEDHVPGYQFTMDLFLIVLYFQCVRKCFSDYRYAMFPLFLWYFVFLCDQIQCLTVPFGLGYFLGLFAINYIALLKAQDERYITIACIAAGCYFYFVYGLVNAKWRCPGPIPVLPHEQYERMYELFGLDDTLKFISDPPVLESTPTTTVLPHVAQQAFMLGNVSNQTQNSMMNPLI